MHRVRRSVLLIALSLLVAHTLIAQRLPWDVAHDHGMPGAAHAQTDPSCSTVPLGAVPGQPAPIWCYDPMEADAPTFVNGANSWVDDFNHGASLADLGPGYRTFQVGAIGRTRHWRHADHWMVDIEGNDADGPPPYDLGAALMRPDRTFRAVNGTLVIEADVAAGVVDYQGVAWPELVVTTAPAPTQFRPNGSYVYEAFPNHWTVGCRLQADGAPTCAMLDNTAGGDSTARVWEISHFQCGNSEGPSCTQRYGGHPSVVPGAHRFCRGTDPDVNCRDRFRWEISADRLTIYVNGIKYMEHASFDPRIRIPAALLNSDVYVYFGDFVFKTERPVTRFHWDRIAVNPPGSPAPPPPGPTATPTPGPVGCNPRPPIGISVAPGEPGQLRVTVIPGAGTLQSIRFGSASNARMSIGGQDNRTGNFRVQLGAGVTELSFIIARGSPGQSTTVQLFVTDACGEWETFVGGGPNAF